MDPWEDDSRRRRRFVPNLYAASTRSALQNLIKTNNDNNQNNDDMEQKHEQLLKDLAHTISFEKLRSNNFHNNSELVDESDIEKWAANEENDRERTGKLF